MHLGKTELGGFDWIRLVSVNTVINLRIAQNVGKLMSSWATGGFSRRTRSHGVGHSFDSMQYLQHGRALQHDLSPLWDLCQGQTR
jgi:hypothetical protein